MRENNFDFMRFVAASLVLFSHAFPLYGIQGEPLAKISGFDSFGGLAVTIFFVISGYLITASCVRNPSPIHYLKNRVLRIFPALIVVILLSIVFMGLCVTTLPTADYFNHPQTHNYLWGITLYKIYYVLPGVFEHLPKNAVNGSLWTLPVEFTMYLVVLVLGVAKLLKPKVIIGVFVVTFFWYQHDKASSAVVWFMLESTLAKNACHFAAGALAYLYRDKIRWDGRIAALSLGAMIVTTHSPASHYIYMLALPYLTLFLAFQPTKHIFRFGKCGDFSYGLYLYAFPVQQTYMYFIGDAFGFWGFVAITWLITLCFAIASWNFVEKRALKLKDFTINKVKCLKP